MPNHITRFERLVIHILYSEPGWARVQIFQGLPETDTPIGEALVDFSLTREGLQRLTSELSRHLQDTSW